MINTLQIVSLGSSGKNKHRNRQDSVVAESFDGFGGQRPTQFVSQRMARFVLVCIVDCASFVELKRVASEICWHDAMAALRSSRKSPKTNLSWMLAGNLPLNIFVCLFFLRMFGR